LTGLSSVSWTDRSPSRITGFPDNIVVLVMVHHRQRQPAPRRLPGLPPRSHGRSAKRVGPADRDRYCCVTTGRDGHRAWADPCASAPMANTMEGQGPRTQRQTQRTIRYPAVRAGRRRASRGCDLIALTVDKQLYLRGQLRRVRLYGRPLTRAISSASP